jgi:hypothetical protein
LRSRISDVGSAVVSREPDRATSAGSKLVPLLLTGSGAPRKTTDEQVEVLVTRILAEKGRGQDTHGPTPGERGIWFRRGGRRDRSLC